MNGSSWWENIILAVILILCLRYFYRGIKELFSATPPADGGCGKCSGAGSKCSSKQPEPLPPNCKVVE